MLTGHQARCQYRHRGRLPFFLLVEGRLQVCRVTALLEGKLSYGSAVLLCRCVISHPTIIIEFYEAQLDQTVLCCVQQGGRPNQDQSGRLPPRCKIPLVVGPAGHIWTHPAPVQPKNLCCSYSLRAPFRAEPKSLARGNNRCGVDSGTTHVLSFINSNDSPWQLLRKIPLLLPQ